MGLIPISAEHPLSKTVHYCAGIRIPECQVLDDACSFEALYASLGVACIATVCDGDCALDVMTLMLGQPQTLACRTALRTEISDYLISRIGETWMQEMMVALQELQIEDFNASISGGTQIREVPSAPAPASVEPAEECAHPEDDAAPTEETFEAMRWASQLENDSAVLSLIRSLPKEIVAEQVHRYQKRGETAVAANTKAQEKIELGPNSRYHVKMVVAQRFHLYCHSRCIGTEQRMPYGFMKTFIADNILWKAKQKELTSKKSANGMILGAVRLPM